MTDPQRTFQRSVELDRRLRELVPGGAHTYAKGRDQFPDGLAPVIAYGRGAHVFDVDGNEYIEYGSGLRAVTLGHAHPYVVRAVQAELERGANFVRPAEIELTAAESFLAAVPTAEMVKFTKNGSDATTAAIRLARAATGRDLVAMCRDGSFFSTDDWYIGRSAMDAGIPVPVRELTLGFDYGDLAGTEALLQRNDRRVAALVLQASTQSEPPEGYLPALLELAHRYGALVVLDEMITGFRWSAAGAQGLYGVTPDLSTFGKAMGNGIAVSALAGRRELMELGGLDHEHERVFLLSTTHGAETHSLAAAIAVREVYEREAPIERMEQLGARLAAGVRAAAGAAGVGEHVVTLGRASNLVFATRDADGKPSQQYRTLFMRQLILGGVLAPSFVVSAALTDEDIERTIEVVAAACAVYRDALDAGDPTRWLGGRSIQPVFRRYALITLDLPAGDLSVVCLGAHPDDIEIGCGATLLTLAATRRLSVDYVVLTGSADRHDEARRAAERFLAGAEVRLHLGRLPDGRLPAHWGEVKQALEDVARSAPSPQVVLAPRRADAHQDHRLLAELVATVWRDALVLHYEIPKWDGDFGRASHYVAITPEVADAKIALLHECFPSQHARDWWDDELFRGVLRLRGMECRARYAEAFVVEKALLGLG